MLGIKRLQMLLGLFTLAIALAPAAEAADGVCDIQSLKGRYGFQASGRVDVPVKAGARVDLAKTETIHFAQVGTLEADGEGNA
ncbi:chromosome partitioning protein [Methylocaldum marinum]|uniref:Chromosome partitioning protein n=1 Tax=Methylocaldum marinum TaxID=1432792 RepID=A0A250KWR0_9GAMM|nr:hypothetical protein [Methylocaldum marinum]BBA35401.1 chromosome partitioning protein [Methylocaldum marinum]